MTLRWRVPAGESRRIAAALQLLMVETRAQHGSLGCAFSSDMGVNVVISYNEDWKTEEDLRDQLLSHRFTALAELMELATEEPSIEFLLPGTVRGLEYADEVRNAASR